LPRSRKARKKLPPKAASSRRESPKPGREIDALLALMAALRTPRTGCPWDLEQTFATIAPYTIEEAYEVAEAIARSDLKALKDELGDLLLQVVFHARMAEEAGAFDFGDVVENLTEKLVRRHPHVFGDAGKFTPEEVKSLWARIKDEERAARDEGKRGTLDNVPLALPALARALKLQEKAAKVGFDWPHIREVHAKVTEEVRELGETLDTPKAAEEIGDLLFALVNLARHLKVDPEAALREANQKFERRFRAIEDALEAHGQRPSDASLEEMDALWNEAKAKERRA
jgi:ATP diphosphatase